MNQCRGFLIRWVVLLRHVHPLWWRIEAPHLRLRSWCLKNVNDHGDLEDAVREHQRI